MREITHQTIYIYLCRIIENSKGNSANLIELCNDAGFEVSYVMHIQPQLMVAVFECPMILQIRSKLSGLIKFAIGLFNARQNE